MMIIATDYKDSEASKNDVNAWTITLLSNENFKREHIKETKHTWLLDTC